MRGAAGGRLGLDDPDGLLPPEHAALGWALAAYRFVRYRAEEGGEPPGWCCRKDRASSARCMWRRRLGSRATSSTRPPTTWGPSELADAVEDRGRFGAECRVDRRRRAPGGQLPGGARRRARQRRAPRLIELTWGEGGAPKLTLVGKGVCFDTGGLDIKPSSGMLLMKKDMGGAALMLALARCVMALACRSGSAC